MWESRHLTTLWVSTACIGIALPLQTDTETTNCVFQRQWLVCLILQASIEIAKKMQIMMISVSLNEELIGVKDQTGVRHF
jgi:hypothetical protein